MSHFLSFLTVIDVDTSDLKTPVGHDPVEVPKTNWLMIIGLILLGAVLVGLKLGDLISFSWLTLAIVWGVACFSAPLIQVIYTYIRQRAHRQREFKVSF